MTTTVATAPDGDGTAGLTRRQTELLDQLEALFLAEGFARFTLDDLAARLHCSKTTLYALAGSKEQLALRVVRHFFRDLDAFAPGRETYERNTALAADRVRQLITDGVAEGRFREVHPALVADTVTTLMLRIGRGETARATGLDDATAYRELAALLLHGISV
jgi:AcrR family transcriptional regulator